MQKKLSFMAMSVIVLLTAVNPIYAFREEIVAAWTMDEGSGKDIGDASGNGNKGEIIGGADWADGKFGKALDFDGSSGYVEIPFDESMRLINQGDFTLAAWFKPDAAPAENKEVFQQKDENGMGRTWLFIYSGSGEIRSYLGNAATMSGINVEAGEWYHTAVVVTEGGAADSVQLYVNGEIAGAPFQTSVEDSDGDYLIGCHKNITNFWDGIIDDVVLIGKALSPDEINDLMINGVVTIMAVNSSDKLATSWGNIKKN
jgi:hypothetical protein